MRLGKSPVVSLTLMVALGGVTALGGPAQAIAAGAVVDQSNATPAVGWLSVSSGSMAQTFTVGRTGRLTDLRVKIGTSTYDVEVARVLASGVPDLGDVVAAAAAPVQGAGDGWIEVGLGAGVPVTAGDRLAIVIRTVESWAQWQVVGDLEDTDGGYDPGSGYTCFPSSGTCTLSLSVRHYQFFENDFAFETLVTPRQDQSLDWVTTAPASVTAGSRIPVSAEATSGLPVSIGTSGPCSYDADDGEIVTTAVGTCTVRADQAGSAEWAPAPQLSTTITVEPAAQSISFAALPNRTYGDDAVELTASATSDLSVTLTAETPATCGLSGTTLTLLQAGTCTIRASQSGSADFYAPAEDVRRSFTIAKATPTLTWASPAPVSYGTALGPDQLSAHASFHGTDLPGAYVYAPAAGTVLGPGQQQLSVTFTPNDEANFTVATSTTTLMVQYTWSGVLQPVNADGSSIFKAGSTVPVKFRLTGASSAVTDATASLTYAKVSNGIEGDTVEAATNVAATTGNLFRYDPAAGQYIFNWSTKGLVKGTYLVRINLGDGAPHVVQVSLK